MPIGFTLGAVVLLYLVACELAGPWAGFFAAVMFVAQPNAGASIQKGLLRIWGSVASGLVSIAIYGLFSQQPPLMLASLCGVIAVVLIPMVWPL